MNIFKNSETKRIEYLLEQYSQFKASGQSVESAKLELFGLTEDSRGKQLKEFKNISTLEDIAKDYALDVNKRTVPEIISYVIQLESGNASKYNKITSQSLFAPEHPSNRLTERIKQLAVSAGIKE